MATEPGHHRDETGSRAVNSQTLSPQVLNVRNVDFWDLADATTTGYALEQTFTVQQPPSPGAGRPA